MLIPSFPRRLLALAFLSSFTAPGHATDITAGGSGHEVLYGEDYRTFRSDHLIFRYDVRLEPLARRLFPRLDAHLAKLQKQLNFRLNRPFPLYLTGNAFGNAYVTYGDDASGSFSVVPSRLTAVEMGTMSLVYSGDEEDFFDTYAHELMHYIEGDQRLAVWAAIFGDAAYRRPLNTGWMAEGWAVVHEGLDRPHKGRMKESFFGALMKSELSERRDPVARGWDLSANNSDWRMVGAHYVVGSNFYAYLRERYGKEKLDDLVVHQNEIGWSSAYRNIYGKSFSELFDEFGVATRKSVEATRREPAPKSRVVFDAELGVISTIGFDTQGRAAFVGRSLPRATQLFRIDGEGHRIAELPIFEWLTPFAGPLSKAPDDWSNASGRDGLYYFSSQENSRGTTEVPGLYYYDFQAGTRRRMKELPLARAATVTRDGDTAFVIRQPDPNESVFVLEKISIRDRFAPQVLGRWSQFSSLLQLSLAEGEQRLVFSAIRPGGTWAVYSAEIAPNVSPKLLVDSPGQDLFPRLTAKGLVFLSDLNAKTFQVYRMHEGCTRALSREPYFVRSLAIGPRGQVWAVSRRGSREVILELADSDAAPACVEAARLQTSIPNEAELAPTRAAPIEESHASTFVPATRVLLPRYDRDAGFGLQVLLSGESPYKDWAWTLGSDFDFDAASDFLVGLGVAYRGAFPWTWNFGTESSRFASATFYQDDARFQNTALSASRSWGGHSFLGRVLHSFGVGDGITANAVALGARHTFSNTQAAPLGAGPTRGWALSTSLETFPFNYAGNSMRTIVRMDQVVYLPLVEGLFPTHSFQLKLTELKSLRGLAYLGGSGGSTEKSFRISSELERGLLFGPVASPFLGLRGYSTRDTLIGDLAVKMTAEHKIPLNFLRYGFAHWLGRRWFNPESQTLNVSFFYDAGYANEQDQGFMSSVGATAEWGIFLNEDHMTGVSAGYILAKELNFDRNLEHTWQIVGQVTF